MHELTPVDQWETSQGKTWAHLVTNHWFPSYCVRGWCREWLCAIIHAHTCFDDAQTHMYKHTQWLTLFGLISGSHRLQVSLILSYLNKLGLNSNVMDCTSLVMDSIWHTHTYFPFYLHKTLFHGHIQAFFPFSHKHSSFLFLHLSPTHTHAHPHESLLILKWHSVPSASSNRVFL